MKPRTRILIIEDDPLLGRLLRDNLTHDGHETELIVDGGEGLARLQQGELDLLILDLMLPSLPGLEILKRLRAEDRELPVLILSARSHEKDRIAGLALGADDYLGKPFALKELLLRVQALLRRSQAVRGAPVLEEEESEATRHFSLRGVEVDLDRYELRGEDGSSETLSARAGQLLELLVEREGQVVERREILARLWEPDADPNPRTIDNFIAHFRKIFGDDPKEPRHFHTLRGVGYRFERNSP